MLLVADFCFRNVAVAAMFVSDIYKILYLKSLLASSIPNLKLQCLCKIFAKTVNYCICQHAPKSTFLIIKGHDVYTFAGSPCHQL